MSNHSEYKSRDPEEDAALIRAFQSGNRIAFDKLVLKHRDRVFSLCYRFLGDYQEADDTAQEVFVKVYKSLKRFKFKSSFSTWLYRIVINTCKNRVKSLEYRNRKKMVRIDNPENSDDSSKTMEIRYERETPMAELEKQERMELIQKAIDSLPSEQREVVVLRDIEGLSYEEITDITGYKLGTLKSRLSRARLGLKKKLRGII